MCGGDRQPGSAPGHFPQPCEPASGTGLSYLTLSLALMPLAEPGGSLACARQGQGVSGASVTILWGAVVPGHKALGNSPSLYVRQSVCGSAGSPHRGVAGLLWFLCLAPAGCAACCGGWQSSAP